ncbi:hypothetical protein ASE92_03805 [Pedobacter sp. Leaf41]|nr:hypothetical protein ASE92_03805 [Pedobacter sp. Leaf41]
MGEESQHKVTPQVWQVRKCTQSLPILMHSSQVYSLATLSVFIALMWWQIPLFSIVKVLISIDELE